MSYLGPFALVIPNGVKANGASCFAVLDPDSGGAKTFSVALYVEGQDPTITTYWGCYTLLESATHSALLTMTTTEFKDYVNGLATERERGQVSGATFKNSLAMGAESFWTFVASQGLKVVAEPL